MLKYIDHAEDSLENQDSLLLSTPLTSLEYNTIYPVINDVEFVGRLFKSKELQEILNETQSNEDVIFYLDSESSACKFSVERAFALTPWCDRYSAIF